MRSPIRNLAITGPSALVLATAVACGSAAGMASGSAASTAPAARSAVTATAPVVPAGSTSSTVALKVVSNPSLGHIVVNGAGKTVYRYDPDKVGSGKSACTGSCATIWPAVTVTGSGKPTVSGVNPSLVGEITRPGGAKQLTIAGSPLYTYTGDTKPGSTAGQGFSGIWWTVTPTGAKAMAHHSPAPSPAPSPGSGGGGY